jgi:hypothetical protein
LLLPVSLACCSCSKKGKLLFPVQGKVFFEGQPTPKALVIFHPLNNPDPNAVKPRALVGPDGSFKVCTDVADDGAAAGEYIVTIVGKKSKSPNSMAKGKGGKKTLPAIELPAHYENPQTSDLHVTIKEGPNELPPFHLKQDD